MGKTLWMMRLAMLAGALGAWAEAKEVGYVGAEGEWERQECSAVESGTTTWSGWMAAEGDVTVSNRIQASGAVNLILCDGAVLTAAKGIQVMGEASLTVWGQTEGSGRLTARGSGSCAGIGGNKGEVAGKVAVYGGKVEALGGQYGAGIGGGDTGDGGVVEVHGGEVKAEGNDGSAGIGGGDYGNGGSFTITGGKVTALGGARKSGNNATGQAAAGIGAGRPEITRGGDGSVVAGGHRTSGTVSILGGEVVAKAGVPPASVQTGNYYHPDPAQAMGVNSKDAESNGTGYLTLGAVAVYTTAEAAEPVPSGERGAACRGTNVWTRPCPHRWNGPKCEWCGETAGEEERLAGKGTLATWPLGNTPTGITELPEALRVDEISAGQGVSSFESSAKGCSGRGWNSAERNEDAYFQFGVTASDRFYLNFGTLAMSLRSLKTGPAKAEVRWSSDGQSWTSAGTFDVPLDGNDKGHVFTADLTGATVGTGQHLAIRLYAWGASDSNGTFRLGNTHEMTLSGTAVGTKSPPTIVFPSDAASAAFPDTFRVAFGVFPDGTIKDWAFSPPPAGPHSLSGKTFTFTPASNDMGKTFLLTVAATNGYGESEGNLSVIVAESTRLGTWSTGFENGPDPAYPNSPVTWDIDGRAWSIQQIAFSDKPDLAKAGTRACVFGGDDEAFLASANRMLAYAHGCGAVSFLCGACPGETAPCPPLVVEIATDPAGGNWMEIGRVHPGGATEAKRAEFDVMSPEPLYLRIRTDCFSKRGRVWIDQLTVTPFVKPAWNSFEQYLLRYNLTPGDPGCASQDIWADGETAESHKTDDFDEDGFSNWDEFKANPQTNPFDHNSHP